MKFFGWRKENDRGAAFARGTTRQTYEQQAEDAASLLSGSGTVDWGCNVHVREALYVTAPS